VSRSLAIPHEALNSIVGAALERADSADIISRCLRLEGTGESASLSVTTEDESLRLDLGGFDRLFVIGIGKAAARMACSLEAVLGERITDGIVVTKYGHREELSRLVLLEAGHPVPDEAGVGAARRLEALLADVNEKTLVISLVSGGGSALLVSPYHDEQRALSLGDLQEVTRLLLSCGATIQETNCLRKHLSAVKGGRLARLMAPATSLNLILSDVVGDDLGSIASGITAPDTTTYGEALEIARRHGILDSLPAAARALIEAGDRGEIPETPGPEDPAFDRVYNVIVGSNTQALQAAAEAARAEGFYTVALTSRLVGEAREVGKLFPALARDVRDSGMLAAPPVCVLAGGETTVTIRDPEGRGGRNQELCLSALRELASGTAEPDDGVVFASVATDGNDGPTDAAGGYIDADIVRRAAADPGALERALAGNDSYTYLDSLGALVRTGPTNTNVCDIQVLLVSP
jgi:hydroxypyruvate reductase